jgi:hypothetical protein
VVWVGIRNAQTPAQLQRNAGREAGRVLPDARVVSVLDPASEAPKLFGQALRLPRRAGVQQPAWDVYLVYARGAPWESPVPVPQYWMHQLSSGAPPDQRLDAGRLRSAIESAEELRAELPEAKSFVAARRMP